MVLTVVTFETGIEVDEVKIGSSTVNPDNYDVDDLEVTLKKTYLATLAEGEKTFTIVMDNEMEGSMGLTVVDTE